MFRLVLATLVLPFLAHAQSVDVKDVNAGDDSTTIEIHKGRKEDAAKPTWEISDGEADVEGDTAATKSEAVKAWKKACNDWKTEFRADNKENKIISISCGEMTCSGDAGSKVCSSKAKYKIKTRVD